MIYNFDHTEMKDLWQNELHSKARNIRKKIKKKQKFKI